MDISEKKRLGGLEKAAVFLLCLGQEEAALILRELDDEEIAALTRCMADVRYIPAATRAAVLREYQKEAAKQAGIAIRGQEIAKTLIARTGNLSREKELMHRFVTATEERPFRNIATMRPAIAAHILEREHPQIQALILSTQDEEHAAAIIAELQETNPADLIRRIVSMESVSADVIALIDKKLAQEIGEMPDADSFCRTGGIRKAVGILGGMSTSLDFEILDELEETDPDMSEALRRMMFTFEDLFALDDRSIQTILREINNESLALAMKAASPEIKEKFFSNMSHRAVAMVKEDLDAMRPVRLSEVEAMQQTIVRIAMRLEEEGKIVMGQGREDAFV